MCDVMWVTTPLLFYAAGMQQEQEKKMKKVSCQSPISRAVDITRG